MRLGFGNKDRAEKPAKAAKPEKVKPEKARARPAPPVSIVPAEPLLPGQYELSTDLIGLSAAHTPQDDALQRTASGVITQHVDLGRRGLAICGPAAGAGVSFMAANLAVALAQSGVSTLLVDANMRRPSLESYFRPAEPQVGLQEHLRSHETTFEDVVHREVLPGLSLAYAGGVAPDAQELLSGERFRAFLRQGMRDFDCTLVDTPAANRSADARVVGAVLGYALIVARRGTSYVDDIALFTEELGKDGVMVIGSILNGD